MIMKKEKPKGRKLTIALISGGISSEREVSLNGGNQVYEAIDKSKYEIVRYDPKTDLAKLVNDAPKIDAALIILHGKYGEDGTIQGMLDLLGIPYQGSGVLGSAVAMNKLAAKHLYIQAGLLTPPYIVIQKEDDIDYTMESIEKFGLPVVIKPVTSGSSIGLSIVKSINNLKSALDKAFLHDHTVLIEKYMDGIELTGGVIGNQKLQALPIVEIIPGAEYEFFDYKAKYTPGASKEICPARINDFLTQKAQDCAIKAHKALFCRGYSRTDMILKENDIYVLETNTIPGMTPTSLLPLAAKTAGISFSQLLDQLIELSFE